MGSHPQIDFSSLIAAVARELAKRRITFMLIGGQAVLLHGRPRFTEDIDITLGIDPGGLPDVLEACATLALEPLPEDPEGFVRNTFVLPVRHSESGIRVDLVFSTTPYESQAIARAVPVEVGGEAVPFSTAEDLVIHKLFAGRPLDWEDAVSVVRRQKGVLDWDYIERWAAEFASVPGREKLPGEVARLREEA
jgi:hypothetical protein